jgi:hypothetical protein
MHHLGLYQGDVKDIKHALKGAKFSWEQEPELNIVHPIHLSEGDHADTYRVEVSGVTVAYANGRPEEIRKYFLHNAGELVLDKTKVTRVPSEKETKIMKKMKRLSGQKLRIPLVLPHGQGPDLDELVE